MIDRNNISQEELDKLFAYAEEALKNVGATDVSTQTSSAKIGKFKNECDKGCKDCQPALCPEDIATERSVRTYFVDEFIPAPAPDPKGYTSNK